MIQWVLAHPIRVFALFYTFCALFIVITADIRTAMGSNQLAGDGFYYYVYARSILIDQDVNFKNEYEEFVPSGKQIRQRNQNDDFEITTGPFSEYPENYFAIGSGLLWLPALAVVHGGLLGLQELGFETTVADGFSQPYMTGVGVIGCFYAFLAILLTYKMLRLRFSNEAAVLTCLFLITTTASINYVLFDPMYSHVSALFTASLVLYLCLKYPSFIQMPLYIAFTIGLSLGLAALVRWQVLLFGLIPFVMWLRAFFQGSAWDKIILKGVVLALGTILVFIPQLICWHSMYGSYLIIPQGTSFFVPRLFGWAHVLLSNKHGMFFTHPITGLAFIGMFIVLRKSNISLPELRLPVFIAFLVFILQAILNGAVLDLDAGTSFGMRRMINTYPILAIGLAGLLATWMSKTTAWKPVTLWLVASFWNAILLGIWLFRLGGDIFPR